MVQLQFQVMFISIIGTENIQIHSLKLLGYFCYFYEHLNVTVK